MTSLGLLRFEPVFRRYLWGGRRLGTVLAKPIGPENDYAECWEVVDHGKDQSIVANGPFRGQTLRWLVEQHGAELFGQHHPQRQFPLLFKFLDSQTDLSLQVHPNDEQAARQTPPDLGKTEAWVILDALPNSVVYAGLKPELDRSAVELAIEHDNLPQCLHQLAAQPGDCLFIPAGTVHALGAGFLVAEIQQASDTTFRLYDWKRLGPDGKPRPLHVEAGLAVTNYLAGPVYPQQPASTECSHVERLVKCDKFVLDRWRFSEPAELAIHNRFHLLVVLSGRVRVEEELLTQGQTLLVPAVYQHLKLIPSEPTVMLDIYLPS
jgi:mannose-6-phosphate isomerase